MAAVVLDPVVEVEDPESLSKAAHIAQSIDGQRLGAELFAIKQGLAHRLQKQRKHHWIESSPSSTTRWT